MVEMSTDPEMVRWTAIPAPYTRAMSEQFAFSAIPRGWDDGSHRGWAIETIDDDGRSRFAGNVDIRSLPIADIGYALHPWARGRGVMSRAVRLAVDWALNEGGVEIVHWRSHVGNEASLRVAHATGFTLHGTTPGLLLERGRVLDAWTGSFRFGDAPLRTHATGPSPRCSSPTGCGFVRSHGQRRAPHRRDLQRPDDAPLRPRPAALLDRGRAAPGRQRGLVTRRPGPRRPGRSPTATTDVMLGNVTVMDLLGANPTSGELGYWTHPDARGKGLMTEAVRAAIELAFAPDGLDRRRLVLYAAAEQPGAATRWRRGGRFTRYGTQRAAERLGDGTSTTCTVTSCSERDTLPARRVVMTGGHTGCRAKPPRPLFDRRTRVAVNSTPKHDLPADYKPWPALWAMVIGFFMILVDNTIVSVATPAIRDGLDTDYNSAIWVTSAYLLAYAVPLLVTGRLGDRFGPKNIYLVGLTLFTLASLWCGLTGVDRDADRRARRAGPRRLDDDAADDGRHHPDVPAGQPRAAPWRCGVPTAGVATLVGPILGGAAGRRAWAGSGSSSSTCPVGISAFVLAWRLVPPLPTHTPLLRPGSAWPSAQSACSCWCSASRRARSTTGARSRASSRCRR